MKKFLPVLFGLFSAPLFAQWTTLNSGTTQWLRAVWFTSSDTGYVVGYGGTILKTNDSGINWMALPSGTTNDLQGVFFLNSTTGWAVGGSATILKTTNGGASWSPQFAPSGYIFHQVQFLDLNNGYVAGEGGGCLKTTDGGVTWSSLTLTSGNGKVSLFFTDVNTGVISGLGFSDAIVKTTNGGTSWTNVYSNNVQEFCGITFKDPNNGFAVSSQGQMAKSTDGGNSWITQNSSAPSLYSIVFPTSLSGYTVGGYPNTGSVLHTSDGGATWTSQISNTTSPLFGVFFTDASTGYAVGKNGTIIKTTNGGVGMEEYLNHAEPSIYPIPASEIISINLHEVNNAKGVIYSAIGEKIAEFTIADTYTEIPISNFSAGVYIFTIDSKTKTFRTKFIKN